ncbi:mechanosensitive ion channel domain-containing protein [Roseibium sp. RKSG952]|uniref:mechanosensitive ion channel domain-containing protein n=1 Tax=Roseibium sp. RKSG952 TaxID=2529384 RepID=UPI0018AD2AC6|nr:mechanosensitive ion channel domain-containing protein [Roseibium sp. RKSG952]
MVLFFRAICFSLLLVFSCAAQAQQTGTATPSAQTPDAPQNGAGGPEGASSGVSVEDARKALIDLLQDPKGRAALIEQLQSLDTGEAADNPAAASPETGATASGEQSKAVEDKEGEAASQPFAVQLSAYTKLIADNLVVLWERVERSLNGATLLLDGTIRIDWPRVGDALLQMGAVLVSAMALFKLGQWALVATYRRFHAQVRHGGWLTRAAYLLVTTAADALTVGIGWIGGYAVAILAIGPLDSGVTTMESLALNAFMVTGLVKVGLRFVFAPDRPELRLLPFGDQPARYWTSRLGFVVFWLGYGIMLAVPAANISVSFLVGNTIRFLVALVGAIFVLALIRHNQRVVSSGIRDYASNLSSELARRTLKRLAGLWSLVAYAYVLVVLGVWLFRPFDAVAIVMRATGLSILTVMGSMLVSLVVARAISGGIRLPNDWRESLPALQNRLNAFVPRFLKLFRLIVFLVTVLILLDIWGVIGFLSWVQSAEGSAFLGRYSSAALVVLAAFVFWLAVMAWVDLRLRERDGYIVTSRARTLFQLFRNGFTVVVIVMAALLALSEVGVNIGPLIAGAGVVGLAISFGAQTLVKDIITGAFIQIENAINEGDVVTVGGITGTVERLTVRSVKMRDLSGTTHFIPFSSVSMVSNFMRDFSYHVALIGVSYDTDIRKAKAAMEEAFRRLSETDFKREIIGGLEMHGVTEFADSSINIRARIKTTPGNQWATGRAYNEFVKDVFDEQDIDIPFPQVTYHVAAPSAAEDLKAKTADQTGNAPAPARLEDDAPPEGER